MPTVKQRRAAKRATTKTATPQAQPAVEPASVTAVPSAPETGLMRFRFTRDYEVQQFGFSHPENPKYREGEVHRFSREKCHHLAGRGAGQLVDLEEPQRSQTAEDPGAKDEGGQGGGTVPGGEGSGEVTTTGKEEERVSEPDDKGSDKNGPDA